jgi:hypothetical protein
MLVVDNASTILHHTVYSHTSDFEFASFTSDNETERLTQLILVSNSCRYWKDNLDELNDSHSLLSQAVRSEFLLTSEEALEFRDFIIRYFAQVSEAALLSLLQVSYESESPLIGVKLALKVFEISNIKRSFEVAEVASKILSKWSYELEDNELNIIFNRAKSYPYPGHVPADFPRERLSYRQRNDDSDNDAPPDIIGASAILLLTTEGVQSSLSRKFFSNSVSFARTYPESTNHWLSPLAVHTPNALHDLDGYQNGSIPKHIFLTDFFIFRAAGFASFALGFGIFVANPVAQQAGLVKLAIGAAIYGTIVTGLGMLCAHAFRINQNRVSEHHRRQIENKLYKLPTYDC